MTHDPKHPDRAGTLRNPDVPRLRFLNRELDRRLFGRLFGRVLGVDGVMCCDDHRRSFSVGPLFEKYERLPHTLAILPGCTEAEKFAFFDERHGLCFLAFGKDPLYPPLKR